MSYLSLYQWQTSFEEELLKREVKVFYHPNLKEDLGMYCGNIYINTTLQNNEKETLLVTVHETVHFLQHERGKLIGTNFPNLYNPLLSEEQSEVIYSTVKEYYDKENWDLEIPAFSLQYNKELVFEYLLNS
jgi:Zn-dependent peptidase ImmA (M78 family)